MPFYRGFYNFYNPDKSVAKRYRFGGGYISRRAVCAVATSLALIGRYVIEVIALKRDCRG